MMMVRLRKTQTPYFGGISWLSRMAIMIQKDMKPYRLEAGMVGSELHIFTMNSGLTKREINDLVDRITDLAPFELTRKDD